MGLTKTEQTLTKGLLKHVPREDVISLAQTVTNNMAVFEEVAGAVEAIVTYSNTCEELLRRQKVTSAVIQKYLIGEKVPYISNSTKPQLIATVLRHWTKKAQQHLAAAAAPVLQTRSSVTTNPASGPAHTGPGPTPIRVASAESEAELEKLGTEFVKWFYPMLNSSAQDYQAAAQNGFHSPHFYPDCHMVFLAMLSPGQKHEEELVGDDNVCRALFSLVHNEQLCFNPNTADGVKSMKDVHGLVVVHVCGTVHQKSQVKGLFQQQFGLIKDPSEGNSFKIKYTNLCIKAT